jgi:hypothetical protein
MGWGTWSGCGKADEYRRRPRQQVVMQTKRTAPADQPKPGYPSARCKPPSAKKAV